MDQISPIHTGHYSHDLLLHEDDDELLAGTLAFVEQGLASGGRYSSTAHPNVWP